MLLLRSTLPYEPRVQLARTTTAHSALLAGINSETRISSLLLPSSLG